MGYVNLLRPRNVVEVPRFSVLNCEESSLHVVNVYGQSNAFLSVDVDAGI